MNLNDLLNNGLAILKNKSELVITAEQIGDIDLCDSGNITVFSASNLKKSGNLIFNQWDTALTKFYIPNLQECGDIRLRLTKGLTEFDAPNLEKSGTIDAADTGITAFNIPKLQECEDIFLHGTKVTVFSAPNLKKSEGLYLSAVISFIVKFNAHNLQRCACIEINDAKKLTEFIADNLQECEYINLKNTRITNFSATNLKRCEEIDISFTGIKEYPNIPPAVQKNLKFNAVIFRNGYAMFDDIPCRIYTTNRNLYITDNPSIPYVVGDGNNFVCVKALENLADAWYSRFPNSKLPSSIR